MNKYPCNQCGLCCKNLDKSDLYKKMHNGNGICFNFDSTTKKCQIYEERPIICDIEKYFNNFNTGMSYQAYLELNILNCQTLQKTNNFPIINL